MSAPAFRMSFILVFIWGARPAALSGTSLDCTNDFHEEMSCCIKAANCSEHSLTLSNDSHDEKQCVFQEHDAGLCCCSLQIILISNEIHKATVWKGNKYVESKCISVTASIKPNTPTIVSLTNSSGNFQLMWETNVQNYNLHLNLSANVTYYKKGSAEKVTKSVGPTTVGGLKFYEIPGGDLEPSTTYVVSVRSYTSWSGKYSDSSPEMEFTTGEGEDDPASRVLATVIGLSAAAVLVTGSALLCYYRIRAEWLDAATKCPKPKLVDMHPGMEKGKLVYNILEPVPTDLSLVSVDPSPNNSRTRSDSGSPGLSAGPASLCADVKRVDVKAGVHSALSKALGHIVPLTSLDAPQPCGFRADFDNMSYFSGFPICPRPLAPGSPEMPPQAEASCSTEGGDAPRAEPQVSSPRPTDMSYQSHAKASAPDSNSVM